MSSDGHATADGGDGGLYFVFVHSFVYYGLLFLVLMVM